jgi:hypothetical protein
MDMTGCPDRAELEGFVVGSLPGPGFARVVDHVERCAACEASLRPSIGSPILCCRSSGG